MPQLMAEANDQIYLKEKNEDFITLLSGIIGQKKHIHIHVGDSFRYGIRLQISAETTNPNKQMSSFSSSY